MTDAVRVRTDDPVGRIAPAAYGHFVEHLGRGVYGGLWVGDDDRVATEDGVRADVLSLLADLEPPVVRWPGGCFADDYHWTDGVGPREERPRRRNLWWAQGRDGAWEEPNAFGTDEFLRVCRRLGAEPYLAGNVGSGTPGELVGWVEYCNGDGDTELADRRRRNGREAPHDVRYWGVGNESWGCGGRYDPEGYALEYRRYANYLRAFERGLGERRLELVACGDTDPDWNRRFLRTLGESGAIAGVGGYELLDHLSVHRYYGAGGGTGFTDEQYFRLLARARAVGRDVDRAAEVLESFVPSGSVGVAVDEWGVWHPEAVPANGLEQPGTVRDALAAASVLDDLNARAGVVSMANLAQAVNVLQCVVRTDETDAWPTPTYRVFDAYRPHVGAEALRTDVTADERTVEVDGSRVPVPLVSASASASDGGVFVTLSNRALDARTVRVEVDGADDGPVADPDAADATVLFDGQPPDARATAGTAAAFAPADLPVEVGDGVVVEAPPASVVAVEMGVR